MSRYELTQAIIKNASSCPYNIEDVLTRVALKKALSAGIIRYLEEIAPGAVDVVKDDNEITSEAVKTYLEAKKNRIQAEK